jgi:CheY-like chemotaxis protein
MAVTSEPKRVLIIDGDNVRRGMLACTLPAAAYALEFAKTSAAGLDKLQQQPTELLLIGHGDESRDLCRHVRSLPAARGCTLVLLDESFRDESVGFAAAEAAGADFALAFPFTLETLERSLERRRRGLLSASSPALADQLLSSESPAADPPPEPDPRDEARAWEAFRARVADLYDHLASRDYFELLGVAREASAAAVKDAYFERSIDFHPDRFMQLDDAELRKQIYEVFKRITEAFKVLSDPDARGDYERQLAADSDPLLRYEDLGRARRSVAEDDQPLATSPAGRKYTNFAELAERNGNLKSARMYLTLASQCEPNNEALRQRLDETTRRLDG